VTATWLLELAGREGARVFNDPRALRDHSEKLAIAEFPRYTAPTLVTRMEKQIHEFIDAHADSTALLLCLRDLTRGLGLKLTVAHLNHSLRARESDGDEAFVQKLSGEIGIRFISRKLDIRKRAAAAGRNLEDAAREVRYSFLRRTAERVGATRIALGHTLNDQAETVLMRLIRGSGLEGLSGIYPVLDNLFIRPLLECSRQDVVQYLAARQASYREDSSNQDLQFLRNRIRIELIPYLQQHLNPKTIDSLARHAELAAETAKYLESQSLRVFERLRRSVSGGLSISVPGLMRVHPALQKLVLRQALKECRKSLKRIASRHIDSLLTLCRTGQSGSQIQFPGNFVVVRQFSDLLFLAPGTSPPQRKFAYKLRCPGKVRVPEAGLDFFAMVRARNTLAGPLRSTGSRVFLYANPLPKTLTIRSRVPGDRYGGSNHRKVKKMLIDARIPLRSRWSIPMVTAGDSVIWIPGFKPAKPFMLQQQSAQCLVLEARSLGADQAKAHNQDKPARVGRMNSLET
jgi:tRNA(Ile)-lysidine synthase